MFKRFFIFLLVVFSFSLLRADYVRIGLFRYYNAKTVQVSFDVGKYHVQADSIPCRDIEKGVSYQVQLVGGRMKLLRGASVIGIFDTIKISSLSENHSFRIKLLNPSKKERKYKGGLFLTANSNAITIVNEVSMSNYLGGVIESEGGGGRHLEYYKVQAVLSRTYAKRNHTRHRSEGFELCDKVHCQAYHHMLRYTSTIKDAVAATLNEVMVDSSFNLAQGYFHANCGGQTSESHYVWNKSISYLWSVKDTFCTKTRQATWTKKIPKATWKNFLVKMYGFPVNDPVYGKQMYNYAPKEREAFYIDQRFGIPLRDLRKKFKLKSTYFSSKLVGEYVVLSGRGFGHGIGLCQEGAMNMAKSKYSYKQILQFYFQGVIVGDYHQFMFFKDDEE